VGKEGVNACVYWDVGLEAAIFLRKRNSSPVYLFDLLLIFPKMFEAECFAELVGSDRT